jgi:hypothetical protein
MSRTLAAMPKPENLGNAHKGNPVVRPRMDYAKVTAEGGIPT